MIWKFSTHSNAFANCVPNIFRRLLVMIGQWIPCLNCLHVHLLNASVCTDQRGSGTTRANIDTDKINSRHFRSFVRLNKSHEAARLVLYSRKQCVLYALSRTHWHSIFKGQLRKISHAHTIKNCATKNFAPSMNWNQKTVAKLIRLRLQFTQ